MANTSLIEFPVRCSSGLPVLASGLVGVVAGVQHGNPPLFALGCVFILGPVLVYLMLRRSSRGLRFHRDAPSCGYEGEPVQINVALENATPASVFFPQLCDVFAPEIHSQKKVCFPGRLEAGESVAQKYQGHCILPRGAYSLGPAAVRVTDPLGWFEFSTLHTSPQIFKILPKIHELGLEEEVGRCASFVCADRTRRGVGESNEFHTTRDYRFGDSPRRIHWPLTARRGTPIVREFARNATGDLSIYLDSHERALAGWGRASSVEYAVKVAIAVASQALRRQREVQMIFGRDGQPTVRTGETRGDIRKFLEDMVYFRARDATLPLPELLERTSHLPGRGATVVVMVNPYLFEDPALEDHLHRLVRQRHRVVPVLFDGARVGPAALQRREQPDVSPVQYARKLRSIGCEPYVMTCGDPVESLFLGAGPGRSL